MRTVHVFVCSTCPPRSTERYWTTNSFAVPVLLPLTAKTLSVPVCQGPPSIAYSVRSTPAGS